MSEKKFAYCIRKPRRLDERKAVHLLYGERKRTHPSFFRIRFFSVCSADKIIQTNAIEFRKPNRKIQRQRAFLALIFGIQGLVAVQKLSNLLLLQIPVFSQITNP